MQLALFLLLATPAPAMPKQPDGASIDVSRSYTLPEMEAAAMKNHALYDLDQDGFVTREELTTYTDARLNKPPASGDALQPASPLVQSIFNTADTDHDGRISAEEDKVGVRRQFASTDTNHDGVVTQEEMLASVILETQRLLGGIGAALKAPLK